MHYKGRQGDFYIMVGEGLGVAVDGWVFKAAGFPAGLLPALVQAALQPCQHPPPSALP